MAVTPDRYGVSGAGLERARTHVEGCLERGVIAGAVIAAARRDQVVQLECVGLRDIEAGLPMTPDTIFQLASMTKLITSVGAMTLVEAGLLGLDDPVSQFVPEFRAMTVFAGVEGDHVRTEPLDRPITIEHLLTQTSGLAYDAPDPILDAAYDDFGDYDYLLPELMRRLAAYPLANQPGDAWRYGWNLDVLGRVIEVAVGQPLDQFFERKIFGPLGMVDSGFRVPPDKADRLAALYTPVDGKLERIDNDETRVVLGDGRLLQGGGSTSGGCVSTAPDYLRFSRMLLRCGELDGVRLLRAETVAEMTRNRLAPAHFPGRRRRPHDRRRIWPGLRRDRGGSAADRRIGRHVRVGRWLEHLRADRPGQVPHRPVPGAVRAVRLGRHRRPVLVARVRGRNRLIGSLGPPHTSSRAASWARRPTPDLVHRRGDDARDRRAAQPQAARDLGVAQADCGADCTESYPQGTVVTLTPTPAATSTFSSWSGNADCVDGVVTMSQAKSCRANVSLIPGP